MGLFTRSKEPEVPLPDLAVHLSSPDNKIFHPDDTVTGHVSFNTPVPLTPQAIEVSFWGMSTVWLRTSHRHGPSDNRKTDYHHYRDNAPLFNVTINVLDSPPPPSVAYPNDTKGKLSPLPQQNVMNVRARQFLPGQTYTFPFQFRIPSGTSSNRSGFYRGDSEAPWTVMPHALPPTMLWGRSQDHPNHAFIEYGITSRLICPGVGLGKHHQDPISSTILINFAPRSPFTANTRFTVSHHPKTFTLATSAFAGIDPEHVGFRQSLRDKLSSSTPSLTFELGLEMPELLTSGAEFRFRAVFTALDKSNNVVKIPALTFRVLKLQLLVFTFVRAPRDWVANKRMDGGHSDGTPTSIPNGLYGPDNGEETEMDEVGVLLNSLPEVSVVELDAVPVQGRQEDGQDGEELPGYNILDESSGNAASAAEPPSSSFEKLKLKLKHGHDGGTDRKTHKLDGKAGEKESGPSSAPPYTAHAASSAATTPQQQQHGQQAKTCSTWFAARVPGTMPPSFVSFAITRAYRLKAKVGVEVAGKRVETEVESEVNALAAGI